MKYKIILLSVITMTIFFQACQDKGTEPAPTVAQPVFYPSGGVYQEPQLVEISCLTEGAEIRYTTDRSQPTESSELYQVPLEIQSNTILTAKAFKGGWSSSVIRTNNYIITGKVADPVFEYNEGTFNAPFNVKISCETENAQIRYTTDGSEPNALSSIFVDPVTLEENTVIKAAAFKKDWAPSNIVKAEYTIEQAETGKVYVNSEPEGALVYINGTKKEGITPLLIDRLSFDTHHIRIYKEGYNEYNKHLTVEKESAYTIDAQLYKSLYPRPHFTIHNPDDDTYFNDNVINIRGLVQIVNAQHHFSSYSADYAILTLNGIDRKIYVNSGLFNTDIAISSGPNEIQLRASSINGNTGVSEPLTVYGSFNKPDIEITLTWNSISADLDLHVWNPLGEHSYYGNRAISDGSLVIDVTSGFGPETFTAEEAMEGTYVVKVNMYSLSFDEYSDASVKLKINGAPLKIYGPKRIKVGDKNGNNPDAWWDVTSFTMENGVFAAEDDAIPQYMKQRIDNDLKNMEKKH